MMVRLFSALRFIIIIPIIGLFIGACVMFLAGGIGMMGYLVGLIQQRGLFLQEETHLTVNLMEFVEEFLTGTVLVIVAAGLYQLFIHELNVPDWLRIDELDDLKRTLIGVIVAVVAVKFLGSAMNWDNEPPLQVGIGMGVMVAALSLFVAVQVYGKHKGNHRHHDPSKPDDLRRGLPFDNPEE